LINISIIIPVKDESQNLSLCLQSIRDAAISEITYEILVIDNGSTDDSVDVAKRLGASVHIVPDITVAGLRNFGAERAEGGILAFIDADCTVEPDWFDALTHYVNDKSIKVFGSPPGIPKSSSWVQNCWYQIRRKDSAEQPVVSVDWLESMNLFVRQDAFASSGGFDVSLVTCEDYDLCMRLSEFGDIVSDSRIRAIHHGEARTIKRFYQKERWRGVSNIAGFRQHNYALSELPSLLFPLVQIVAMFIAFVLLFLWLVGAVPVWYAIAFIAAWQIPLLIMAFKKSDKNDVLRKTGGIWLLLNIYLTARGQSLFKGAAWK